jgi:hypothetical protein
MNVLMTMLSVLPIYFIFNKIILSVNRTDRHDIAEILLKVALKHQKSTTTKMKPLISTKQTNH